MNIGKGSRIHWTRQRLIKLTEKKLGGSQSCRHHCSAMKRSGKIDHGRATCDIARQLYGSIHCFRSTISEENRIKPAWGNFSNLTGKIDKRLVMRNNRRVNKLSSLFLN